MKITFTKNKNELMPALLLGLSAVFGLIILIKTGGFLVTSVGDGMLVKKAIAQSSLDPNEVANYFAKSKAQSEELKKKNLFVMPKPNPGGSISGILGDEVLINGRWYKVGDKVEDAEIIAIEPTQVKIRWNGQEAYFSPSGVVSAAKPKQKEEKPIAINKNENKTSVKKPAPEVQAPTPVEEDPFAWMGVQLSEKVRAKLLEKWNTLSDAEKEQAKEQWNNLSDDQKQQAADIWEQNF